MPEIVIIGKDGTEHVFPDGFDPKRAAEIVRAQDQGHSEEKTASGFGQNLISSFGNFVGDTAKGLIATGKAAMYDVPVRIPQAIGNAVGQAIVKGSVAPIVDPIKTLPAQAANAGAAIAKGAKDRYGSIHNIGETLYNDPVGVLGDVAAVAGALESGGGSLAARLGVEEVPAVAKALKGAATVEKFTNPMNVITNPVVAKGLEKAGDMVINHSVRPAAPVKRWAGEGRMATNQDIIDDIKTTGALTAKGAEKRIQATQKTVDELVRRGMDSDNVKAAITANYPNLSKDELAKLLEKLPDHTVDPNVIAAHVEARIQPTITKLGRIGEDTAPLDQMVADRTQRIRNSGPGPLTIEDALEAKRAAQSAAYDHPRISSTPPSFERDLHQLTAQAYKAATEKAMNGFKTNGKSLSDLHKIEEKQIAAKQALLAAEQRHSSLHDTIAAALSLGSFAATGNPHSLATGLPLLLWNNPTVGVGIGLGLDKTAKLFGSRGLDRAALIAALEGRLQDQQDEDK